MPQACPTGESFKGSDSQYKWLARLAGEVFGGSMTSKVVRPAPGWWGLGGGLGRASGLSLGAGCTRPAAPNWATHAATPNRPPTARRLHRRPPPTPPPAPQVRTLVDAYLRVPKGGL